MKPNLHYGRDVQDVLQGFKADWFHCVVTSPPYWGLRAYCDDPREIGREKTPAEYVERMVSVCRDIRRVLRPDGTLWLNIAANYDSGGRLTYRSGQSANLGHNVLDDAPRPASVFGAKQLIPIPWMLGLALQADGWILRSDIIWAKPNPMPESVRDRPTRSHEYLFLLTKSPTYFYDWYAIAEPVTEGDGIRNKRDVWPLSTQSYRGAHFATFPARLVEPCILAGSSVKCCSACGAPWERVTDRERRPTRPGETTKVAGANSRARISHDPAHESEWNGKADKLVVGNRDPLRHITEYVDRGFVPGCECNAQTKPCRVLDPFAGSGTTGLVAMRHGRRFTGIDLHGEYEKLALERIAKAT